MTLHRSPLLLVVLVALGLFLWVAALPPWAIPGMGLICGVPLLYYCRRQPGTPSAIIGASTGFFLANVVFKGAWAYSIPLGLALISLITFSLSVFCYFISRIRHWPASAWCFTTGLLAAGLEGLAQIGGIPWSWVLLISHDPHWIALLSFIGPLGVSTLLFTGQAAIAILIIRYQTGQPWRGWGSSIVFSLISVWSYGHWQLSVETTPSSSSDLLTVAVIQSHLPPYLYTHLERPGYLETLQKTRERLLAQALHSPDHTPPDWVVWPEVSFAGFEFRHAQPWPQTAAHQQKIAFLVASPDIDTAGTVFNSLFSISAQGKVQHRHDKQSLIPWAEAGLQPGTALTVHTGLPGNPLGLICVESGLLTRLTRQYFSTISALKPGWIAIATSDTYAGYAWIPWLHFEFARLWAVALQKPVVRAANGGLSAIIDAQGRIQAALPIFTEGVITATIQPNTTPSFFMRYTPWVQGIILAASFIAMLGVMIIPPKHLPPVSNTLSNTLSPPIIALTGIACITCAALALVIQTLDMQWRYQSTHSPLPFDDPVRNQSLQLMPPATDPAQGLVNALSVLLRQYGITTPPPTAIIEPEIRETALLSWIQQQGFQVHQNQPQSMQIYTPAVARLSNGEYGVILDWTTTDVRWFSATQGHILILPTSAFQKQWDGYSWWLAAAE